MIRRSVRVPASGWQADNGLTWGARGLLGFILAQPDNFRVSREQLWELAPDGQTVIRRLLKELTAAKYIKRESTQGPDGRWRTDTVVYDEPREDAEAVGIPPPLVGNRMFGDRMSGEQPVEAVNQVLVNQSQNLAPPSAARESAKKERPRDPLFDAMVEELGHEPQTKSERGRWNRALKEIRDQEGTSEGLHARADRFRALYPRANLTPTALSGNWGSLGATTTTVSPMCEKCQQPMGEAHTDYRCEVEQRYLAAVEMMDSA